MIERIGPPVIAGEREMMRAFLDYHRATLAMKCDGLDDEQLCRRSMPPSTLSLLGLVRHMAEVERTWFRIVINGEDIPLFWSPENDYQVAYDPTGATRSAAACSSRQAPRTRSRSVSRSALRSIRATSRSSRRNGSTYAPQRLFSRGMKISNR